MWRVPAVIRSLGSDLAVCRFAVFVLLVLTACDSAPPCEPFDGQDRRFLAVVATTAGDTLRTFPFVTADPNERYIRAQDARLEMLDDDLLLVSMLNFGRVFDITTGEIVVTLSPAAHYTVRGHDVYSVSTNLGTYQYAPDIATYGRVISSTVERHAISESGNSERSTVFETSTSNTDDGRFEMIAYLLVIPKSDGSLLYVRDHEIVTVTTDSAGMQVHFDRYYFERSLWRFKDGSHEKIMTLPDPLQEWRIDQFDHVPDGDLFVYQDREKLYLVDASGGTVEPLNEGSFNDRLSHAVLSESGRYALALAASCAQHYEAIDLVGNERWLSFSTTYCDANTATFSGSTVFFADTRNDTIGVWSQPVTRRISEGSPASVFIANDVIPVRREHHLASLSAPVFVSDDEFVVLHTYQAVVDECR